jgi:hypothetical protein
MSAMNPDTWVTYVDIDEGGNVHTRRARVVRVEDADHVDLSLHDDNGSILRGVSAAPRAVTQIDRSTPGFWF